MKIRTIIAAICAALAFSMAGPIYAHDSEAETVTKNFEAAIPNIPGKSLIAVEVDYAPGAASPSHTHAKSAFIYAYVISGAIELKVNDGETRIYRAGESWSEPPGAIHSISRNASKTEPAKLLAVFVLDTNRGIWCPYCRQDLKYLGNAAPDIRSCGASLVAIAHQIAPDSNGKFQREHGLESPILDDRQGDVAVAYRIRWSPQELAAAEERLGSSRDWIPKPPGFCRCRRATSSGAMASSSTPISMPTIGSILIPVRSCRFCVR